MARRPAHEQGDTLGRIRKAAFTLFGRYGYDGVSMLAVAKASKVTKAALYWHYASKEALYADSMRRLAGLFDDYIFVAAQRAQTPVDGIFALFSGLERLIDDARVAEGIAGYWLKPSTADIDEARAVQTAFEARAQRRVRAILAQAQAAGALRIEVSAGDMARAFTALMQAIVLPLGERSAPEQQRQIGVLRHIFFQAHACGSQAGERAARLLPHRVGQPRDRASIED